LSRLHDPRIVTRFVLGPNASLSVRGAWVFMGLASFATLGCALWCTFLGFWPVLPFAGLELMALGVALWVSMRRNAYREVVSFGEDTVRIEFGLAGRGAAAQVEFPRYWTRVWRERDGSGFVPTRLVLGSSAQRVEIGACLTDEEREELAARFNSLLQVKHTGRADGADPVQAGTTLGER
jgi:uncharacterized membrane protein